MPLDRPIVVFDTETATLSGAPHLLELGAVRVVDGEVVEEFEELVAPAVEVEPEATEIHGITNDDVRTASTVENVLARFADWVGNDWLCAPVRACSNPRTRASKPAL
ncbi:MAG: exonuclease domain-containing protein, partial [Planctomycetota bacterium]